MKRTAASARVDQQLCRMARIARRLLWARWLALAAAATVAIAAVLGVWDYWLAAERPLVRWLQSSVLFVGIGVLAGRCVWLARRVRWGPIDVARCLERRYRHAAEGLSSAVAFSLAGPSACAGTSPSLRRRVVADATRNLRTLRTVPIWETGPARRAISLAALLVGTMLALALLVPTHFQCGAIRLIAPWQKMDWPTAHRLAFVSLPHHVLRGDDVVVRVTDRQGSLPDRVLLWCRPVRPGTFAGDWRRARGGSPQRQDAHEQPGLREYESVSRSDNVATFRIEDVSEDCQLRATGGDDDRMAWHLLDAVDPPLLTEVRFSVIPPEYTGREATEKPSVGDVLEGSCVLLTARCDRPLRTAWLHIEWFDGRQQRLSARLEEGGTRLAFGSRTTKEWTIESSGRCWLELHVLDPAVSTTGPGWSFRAVKDQQPSIAWRIPEQDFVATPLCRQPVWATAVDDIQLNAAALQIAVRSGRVAAETAQPDVKREQALALQPYPIEASDASPVYVPHRVDAKTIVDLTRLPEARPGSHVGLRVTASDVRGQSAFTDWRWIRLVSPTQLIHEALATQEILKEQLNQMASDQRQLDQQLDTWASQRSDSAGRDRAAIQGLVAIQSQQRRLADHLAGSPESLAHQAREWLKRLEANQLSEEPAALWFRELDATSESLVRGPFVQVHQAFVALHDWLAKSPASSASNSSPTGEDFATLLQRIHEGQLAIAQALERLAANLLQHDVLQKLLIELAEVRSQQRRLYEGSLGLLSQTLGLNPALVPSTARVQTTETARAQAELATRLERLLSAPRPARADADGASSPARATQIVDRIRQLELSSKMWLAAGAIEENRLGEATGWQRQVLDGLDGLVQESVGEPSDARIEPGIDDVATSEQTGQPNAASGEHQADQASSPDGLPHTNASQNAQASSSGALPDGSSGAAGTRPGQAPAAGPGDGTEHSPRAAGFSDASGQLHHRLWGQLPAQLRQRVQAGALANPFLPGYEQQTIDYFRRVAENAAGNDEG